MRSKKDIPFRRPRRRCGNTHRMVSRTLVHTAITHYPTASFQPQFILFRTISSDMVFKSVIRRFARTPRRLMLRQEPDSSRLNSSLLCPKANHAKTIPDMPFSGVFRINRIEPFFSSSSSGKRAFLQTDQPWQRTLPAFEEESH